MQTSGNDSDYKYYSNTHLEYINNNIDSESNYFSPVWNQILKNIKIHNLLDMGCGTGIFSCNLKSKISGKLIGVDGSNYGLKKAKENGFDEIYRVEDFCSQSIPLANESVDFVLCKDVFEHLLEPLNLLLEIQRVLTPGGYLLTLVPNHFPIAGRLKFLFTNNLDTFNYFPDSKGWNNPHIRFYTYESLLDFLAQADLKLVENYSGFFPKLPLLPNRVLRYLIPQYLTTKLVNISPSQFATGLTVLVKKD